MKLSFVSTLAVAVALVAHSAQAQESSQQPQPATSDEENPSEDGKVVLEEIIVTADREGFGADLVQVGTFRNARIVDVPLTVNVVPQELLKAQAVDGLYDALRNTAGVSRSQTNGATFDNVSIRGIGVENRTSFRLNGSLPVINLVDLPIENKDRVEVLKGVGALYYGYAPPSGIINFVTKRANRDVTDLSFAVNEYGGTRGTVDFGRLVTDDFGIRINASAGNVENGIERFGGDRYVAALAADLRVSDAIKFSFDVEHISKNVTEPANIGLAGANSPLVPPQTVGVRILPPIPDPEVNLGGEDLRSNAFATNALLRADIRLSSQFALTIEGGQAKTGRDRDAATFQNYDLRPTSANYGNGQLSVSRTRGQRYRNRNIRAELAGAFATGPVVHNLIVGATSNWRFQNGRSSSRVNVPQNFFNPVDAVAPEPTVFTTAPLNIEDRGAYIVDRAQFGPVELLGGVRYTDYQSKSVSSSGAITEFSVKTLTPSVGLVVKPTADMSIYATYLEGLEEVPPAPLTSALPADVLPPAKSKQYEGGFKFEPQLGLLLQIAGFQIDRPSAFVDPADNIYKLAGRARYRGVESSITGEINRNLSVYLSGQYLSAKVTASEVPAVVGKTPENTPKWTGSAYVEFKPDFAPGLAAGAGVFYVSSRPVNALNEAFVDGYATYSLSLRYDLDTIRDGFSVQLNADNLTNERYFAGTGSNVVGYGAPRLVKLTTRFSF